MLVVSLGSLGCDRRGLVVYLYACPVPFFCNPPSLVSAGFIHLCPLSLPIPLCLRLVNTMVMVLTCNTLFSLVIMMPNLQTHLWWMESDLTLLLNPLNPLGQPLLVPLNSDWEAMVVISSQHLTQNLVLNMDFLNIQGMF